MHFLFQEICYPLKNKFLSIYRLLNPEFYFEEEGFVRINVRNGIELCSMMSLDFFYRLMMDEDGENCSKFNWIGHCAYQKSFGWCEIPYESSSWLGFLDINQNTHAYIHIVLVPITIPHYLILLLVYSRFELWRVDESINLWGASTHY